MVIITVRRDIEREAKCLESADQRRFVMEDFAARVSKLDGVTLYTDKKRVPFILKITNNSIRSVPEIEQDGGQRPTYALGKV